MNLNHKLGKYTALAVTAGTLIAGSGITSYAAPIAGASVKTASTLTTLSSESKSSSKTTDSKSSTISGVSEVLAKVVSSSQKEAAKKADDTTEVAASENTNAAAETNAYANIGVANVADGSYTFIRTAADANSDYAGKLYANQIATVDGEEGDWYHVTSGDVTGYINKQYLTVGDENKVKSVAKTIATVNTTTLNVRDNASADANIVTMVAGTTEQNVTDTSTDGWVKISGTDENGNAFEGYVSTDYVSLATQYNYAESKAAEEQRIAAEQAAQQAAAEEAARQQAAAQQAAAARQQARSTTRSTSNATSSSTAASSSASSSKSYSAPSGSNGSAVVAYAAQFVGNPYVYGGTSLTNGCDCSGFVMSVYAKFGVSLPHYDGGIRGMGRAVSTSEMQPGDVVCYSGHVGIYAGNGMIINALNKRKGITYTNVNFMNILSVRRFL